MFACRLSNGSVRIPSSFGLDSEQDKSCRRLVTPACNNLDERDWCRETCSIMLVISGPCGVATFVLPPDEMVQWESKRRLLSHHAGHAGATGHILLLFVACPSASQPSFRRVVLAGRHVLFWELAEPAPWKTSPLRALLKRRKNAQHMTRLLGNSARASIVAECAERCSLCSARRPPPRLPLVIVGQQFLATNC